MRPHIRLTPRVRSDTVFDPGAAMRAAEGLELTETAPEVRRKLAPRRQPERTLWDRVGRPIVTSAAVLVFGLSFCALGLWVIVK